MTAATCPSGHPSVSTDYCDVCGLPIGAARDAGPPHRRPTGGTRGRRPPPRRLRSRRLCRLARLPVGVGGR